MATLIRDIRCSWDPKQFHDPPDGNNLRDFTIKIRIKVLGLVGGFFLEQFDSGTLYFPSSIGDQDVRLGNPCIQADAPVGGWVLFRVLVEDPPVVNNSPPPSECDVWYGDPGSGAGGFNEGDSFTFGPSQELVDHCSLEKWHIVKQV